MGNSNGVREDWFPTSVWYFDWPDGEQRMSSILTLIEAERTRDPVGMTRSNTSGWHSADDLHRRPEFQELFTWAFEGVRTVIDFERWDLTRMQPRFGNAWAVINPPGASNAMHNHPNSVLSGAIYVKAHPQCGDLVFRDPREQASMVAPYIREHTPWTYRAVRYRPQVGRMLVFPAWLLHAVESNQSDQERVVISFNLVVDSIGQPL